MGKEKGFTIIELIVVIAIIAILAAIVLTNVSKYIGEAKKSRAYADVANIEKALNIFYAQYGEYPGWTNGGFGRDNGMIPCSSINGTQHCLDEFYKSDWVGYNASYFVPNGYFQLYYDNGGGPNCAYVLLEDNGGGFYGIKTILSCSINQDQPFQFISY